MLKAMNTHFVGALGLVVGIAGFLGQPTIAGQIAAFVPARDQAMAAWVLSGLGLLAAYYGRPHTVTK